MMTIVRYPGRVFPGIFMLVVLALAACGQPPASVPAATSPDEAAISGDIVVFAAASLTEAYTELGNAFEQDYPAATVTLNFAGSQQLAQQLGQGAPADVFASANARQMGVAIEAGRVISGTQQMFAHNRLVVIVSNESATAVTHLQDLAEPGLKLILAAKEVPVGSYTLNFLDKAAEDEQLGAAYREVVRANVVSYEQNVKAVVTKIVLGEGDAGIVYSSDVTDDAAEHLTTMDIPDHLNTIATYPIAAVSDSANAEAAQAFVGYVLSPQGQAILQRHGFIPVTGSTGFILLQAPLANGQAMHAGA